MGAKQLSFQELNKDSWALLAVFLAFPVGLGPWRGDGGACLREGWDAERSDDRNLGREAEVECRVGVRTDQGPVSRELPMPRSLYNTNGFDLSLKALKRVVP